MGAEPVEFEVAAGRRPDAHVRKLFGAAADDDAAAAIDLEQRAADPVRVARELHRGGVGEKLALARDNRLYRPACEHTDRTEYPEQESKEEQAGIVGAGTLIAVRAAAARHHRRAHRAEQHDARDHTEQRDVEPHVPVQDMAELVRDYALKLLAAEVFQCPARDDHCRAVRREAGSESVDGVLVVHDEHERHRDARGERHLLDDVQQLALRGLGGVALNVARADHRSDSQAPAGELIEPVCGAPGDHCEDHRGGPAVDVAGNLREQVGRVEGLGTQPDVDCNPDQVEHRDDRGHR